MIDRQGHRPKHPGYRIVAIHAPTGQPVTTDWFRTEAEALGAFIAYLRREKRPQRDYRPIDPMPSSRNWYRGGAEI